MEGSDAAKTLLADRLNCIKEHAGAGMDAMDVFADAYKKGNVFDNLADYIKFICFFYTRLESGDREKYNECSNGLYALEQINVWLMMRLVDNEK